MHFELWNKKRAKSKLDNIIQFYQSVNDDYYPSISNRNGGIAGQVQRVIDNDGFYSVVLTDDIIAGAVSFYPIYDEKTIYFFYMAFHKRLRNTFEPKRMVLFIDDIWDDLGFEEYNKVMTKTWYDESRRRLEGIGFSLKEEIQGDMVFDRISYIYEAEINKLRENIARYKRFNS